MFSGKKVLKVIQLQTQQCMSEFSSQKKIITNMAQLSSKLKQTQTVADKKKLSQFLHSQTTSGKLQTTLNRTAQYDQQFAQFLKEYNAKNKQYPNIIDLSHYTRESNIYNKPQQLREDELSMLEEFRKRRQQALIQENLDEAQQANEEDQENEDNEDGDGLGGNVASGDGINLNINDDFVTLLIQNDVTTQTTKLNRVNHFRYLVFMGNANGVIGYGKGKGNDFEEALDNAILHCKKNLIAVPLDHFMSFPQEISTKYNDVRLKLMPRDNFNAWGNPVLASMIILTGITHCSYKLNFRNMNAYAMVYAYFKLVTQNLTPRDLCEQKGTKIYRENFGKPLYHEHTPYMKI